MALIPPMISSLGGTGPDADQIPLSTYKGEVPMSEYMIPSVWKLSMASAKPDACIGRRFGLRTDELTEGVDISRESGSSKVEKFPRSGRFNRSEVQTADKLG